MAEDHARDRQSYDEPPGGWVTGPELINTEVLLIQLCRFTGSPLEDGGCIHRALHRHPDEVCETYFVSAKALQEKWVDMETLDLSTLPVEVRSGSMGIVSVIDNA